MWTINFCRDVTGCWKTWVSDCRSSTVLNILLLFYLGPAASVNVKDNKEIEIENGNPVSFDVEIHDAAGNFTNDGKLICTCKVGVRLSIKNV